MPTARRPHAPPAPPAAPTPAGAALAAAQGPAPADVILDVEVDADATLHFVLANIGAQPAHAVRVRFGRALRDLAGQRLAEQPLYTRLGFLAPGRRVRLFVDTLDGWARRRQPEAFRVTLTWQDDEGRARRRTIDHDLGAWTALRTTL